MKKLNSLTRKKKIITREKEKQTNIFLCALLYIYWLSRRGVRVLYNLLTEVDVSTNAIPVRLQIAYNEKSDVLKKRCIYAAMRNFSQEGLESESDRKIGETLFLSTVSRHDMQVYTLVCLKDFKINHFSVKVHFVGGKRNLKKLK